MPIEQRFRLFVQWLGNQPADGRYCFADTRNCALAQFAKSLDGVADCIYIGAGADALSFVFKDGSHISVRMLPDSGFFGGLTLQTNGFGRAYNGFAARAGLPRRSWVRGVLARLLAHCVKHHHPLAA
jgi:hypothetical protein